MRSSQRALLSATSMMAGSALAVLAAPGAAPAAESRNTVEEIVVTAQRREERLQDVPITITAITASALSSQGIKTTTDLTMVVPGLVMGSVNSKQSPYLRGVGNASSGAGIESSTAVYVDGVYIPSKAAGFASFYNIARIEVLKGPQGTLFGRNSVGGLIQIVTQDPSVEPILRGSAGYANYQTVEAGFYASSGLADHLAGDVSVYYFDQGKGFGRNVFTGSQTQKSRNLALRGKLRWDDGKTSFTLAGDYAKQTDSTGLPSRGVIPGTFAVGLVPHVGGFHDANESLDPLNRNRQWGGSLRIEHEFGPARFVSLTARRLAPEFQVIDLDATPAGIYNYSAHIGNKMFSQEVQLLSKKDSKIEWVGGLYYMKYYAYIENPRNGTQFGPLGPASFNNRHASVKIQSRAAYGQATLHLAESTRLTVGGRYTRDKAHGYGNDETNAGRVNIIDSRASFGSPSWRVSLDHRLSPEVMVYAGYNRGFKSGGYSTSSLRDGTFQPEKLDAYEFGEKADLLGGALRLNGSVFYYKYKDMQVTANPPGLTGTRIINAARATIKGAELEGTAIPTDRLQLHGALAYTQGKFDAFLGAPFYFAAPAGGNVQRLQDASGNQLPRTPHWTVSGSGVYTQPTEMGDIALTVQLFHSSSYFWLVDNRLQQKPVTLVNAELAWKAKSSPLGVRLWARNLFGEKYFTEGFEDTFLDSYAAAPPATFGVTATWNMN